MWFYPHSLDFLLRFSFLYLSAPISSIDPGCFVNWPRVSVTEMLMAAEMWQPRESLSDSELGTEAVCTSLQQPQSDPSVQPGWASEARFFGELGCSLQPDTLQDRCLIF